MYQLAVLLSNYHTKIKLKSGHIRPYHFGYKAYITVRIAVVLSNTIANYHINKYPEHCDSNKKQICLQTQTHCEVFLCTTHTFRHSVFSVVTQKSLNLNRCLSLFSLLSVASQLYFTLMLTTSKTKIHQTANYEQKILLHPSIYFADSDCGFVHKHAGLILAMCLQFEIKLFIIVMCIRNLK